MVQPDNDIKLRAGRQKHLVGKVALITGGSRGIGKACVLRLAQAGLKVVFIGRDTEALSQVSDELSELGLENMWQALDVKDENAVKGLADLLDTRWGGVDVLVNNAGVYKTMPVLGHESLVWNETLATNLSGPFYFCRAFLPGMLKKGWGRIVNIASVSGKQAEMHGAAYSASKFGLIGFSQSLALETAKCGITVNAVCPGWVQTKMTDEQLLDPDYLRLSGESSAQSVDNARLSIPQERFIDSEEVAEFVHYLCTESARGITGQAINICGGMCLT